MKCYLCPNMCGVDRAFERGKCLAGEKAVVNRAALHFYEEPPISGVKGSGTVFFGGCVMRCEFCQNHEISRAPEGKEYTPEELAALYRRLEREGAHNINLVTPTQWSREIRASFDVYRPSVPVVYNTSGYERREIIREMSDYADVFLPDFKYSDESLGRKLSLRADYPRTALDAIEEMLKAKPPVYENGLIKQGVIIRHLVLPGYVRNSIVALDMLAERFGKVHARNGQDDNTKAQTYRIQSGRRSRRKTRYSGHIHSDRRLRVRRVHSQMGKIRITARKIPRETEI